MQHWLDFLLHGDLLWFIQTINYTVWLTLDLFLFIIFIASLDDIGFAFINRCIQAVETRGEL